MGAALSLIGWFRRLKCGGGVGRVNRAAEGFAPSLRRLMWSSMVFPMEVAMEKAAVRRIKQLPRQQREALPQRLPAIAAGPFVHLANVKPLAGQPDCYRLRVGYWRAIYRLDHQSAVMIVMKFEPRGSAC